jgi:hypothetical protein
LNDNQIPSLDGIEAALAGSREKLTTIYLERNPCVSISRLRCLVIDCYYKPIGLNMSLCHPFFLKKSLSSIVVPTFIRFVWQCQGTVLVPVCYTNDQAVINVLCKVELFVFITHYVCVYGALN